MILTVRWAIAIVIMIPTVHLAIAIVIMILLIIATLIVIQTVVLAVDQVVDQAAADQVVVAIDFLSFGSNDKQIIITDCLPKH